MINLKNLAVTTSRAQNKMCNIGPTPKNHYLVFIWFSLPTVDIGFSSNHMTRK